MSAEPQPKPETPPPVEKKEPPPIINQIKDKIEKKLEPERKDGIHGVIEKAKDHAASAGEWIKEHPMQAGLIGAGVAIGSLVVGWIIFKALKGGKEKKKQGSRLHARSADPLDEVMANFPQHALERRAIIDEIDWDDEEFLEFMSLLPDLDEIAGL
jgi:hypothetical protein